MKRIAFLLVCIWFLGNYGLVHAETRALLYLNGIEGDVSIKEYEGWINISDWSWQISSESPDNMRAASKPVFSPIFVNKRIDKASPLLAYYTWQGITIPEAILVFLGKGEVPETEYLRITLTEVQISNVSAVGTSGDDRFSESIALDYSGICYKYIPILPSGAPGGAIEECFDLLSSGK